jgi:hypothetical protein
MYQSPKSELSIWGESYAGHWVPGVASFIETQNDKIAAGELTGAAAINIDTVGIVNGGIDFKVTAASYPHMAYNNVTIFFLCSESCSLPRFCSDMLPDLCFIFPTLNLWTKHSTNSSQMATTAQKPASSLLWSPYGSSLSPYCGLHLRAMERPHTGARSSPELFSDLRIHCCG